MTDKEIFQRTIDKLHASLEILTEVLNMTTETSKVPIRRNRYMKKVAAAAAALVLVVEVSLSTQMEQRDRLQKMNFGNISIVRRSLLQMMDR